MKIVFLSMIFCCCLFSCGRPVSHGETELGPETVSLPEERENGRACSADTSVSFGISVEEKEKQTGSYSEPWMEGPQTNSLDMDVFGAYGKVAFQRGAFPLGDIPFQPKRTEHEP